MRTENISVGDIGADNISEDNISTDNISEDNISEDSISSDIIGAGSFDSSGVFPRVKVIHTENGGVAKARNTGLAAAAGRYVTWVDSDDWIEKDILGKILEKADKWEADVILFDGWEVLPGDIHPYSAVEEPFVLGEGRLARAEYLLTKPCPWNKWIRRDILARRHDCPDFRFPEGEIYEDLSIIPSLAMRTNPCGYKSPWSGCFHARASPGRRAGQRRSPRDASRRSGGRYAGRSPSAPPRASPAF